MGTILSCDQAGVRLSVGFFDEIYVPKVSNGVADGFESDFP